MPNLLWSEVRDRAIAFSRTWAKSASEHADKQTFWNEFFAVFGRERRTVASFEVAVKNLHGTYHYIDLLWRGVLLVEHKTRGKSLAAAESQAFAYIEDLAREGRFDETPRFIIVSDFARVALYDLEPDEQADLPLFAGRRYAVTDFALGEFHRYVRHFAFLKGERTVRVREEDPANQKAYGRMCDLHDELEANGFRDEPLERCLVRLLFCLFADDTGVFDPGTFETFIQTRTRDDGTDLGLWLNKLFAVLNTPETHWNEEDREIFAGFRYVNGELFQNALPFPGFNRSTRHALLEAAAFQWARVSPAVFGSLFQGIMEKGERRRRGAHYTSERDILKVVRSLFLESLDAELLAIAADASTRRAARIKDYLAKLRTLRFLDPACGCGNFLVVSYRELRRLELRALRELHADGAQAEALGLLVQVDVDQFYGIEIDRWPAEIARAAMWLMDHQMNQEVTEAFARDYARLPLLTSPHILCDNALRVEWNTVLDPKECSYVLGNPPFIGKHLMDANQSQDIERVWGHLNGSGLLDYVTAWYRKAAEYIRGTRISVAFVSTNSITQGEQAGLLWNELFQKWNLKIHFAHRTLPWTSEARGAAHVHVVIIGFGTFNVDSKRIYDYEHGSERATETIARNISPYLLDGPDVALPIRRKTLCEVPEIIYGNKPADGGFLLVEDEVRTGFLRENPGAEPYLKAFVSADEYLNGRSRWVLWLNDAPPQVIRDNPGLRQRVEGVQAFRAASKKESTRRGAAYPATFAEVRQPTSEYILIPRHSSERRKYVPFGYFGPDVIIGDSCTAVRDASFYHFGVLSSAMHMAWMRTVCGRLESRYRYSNKLVYNNFPWPENVHSRRAGAVDASARNVIEARTPFLPPVGTSTLSDLYDPLTMPASLAKAHLELDRTVDRCYRDAAFRTDRERVEHLFALYEKIAVPLLPVIAKKKPGQRTGAVPKQETITGNEPTPEDLDEAETPPASDVAAELPWYEDALSKMQAGFSEDGTDRLADQLEEMISAGDFGPCNADLAIIADREANYPLDALISILTFSRTARTHLPNRARLREAVERRLVALGKNPQAILRRL